MARHYGLDWLRIAAFGLLILYHVAMVFAPWAYHVKSTHIADWITLPMQAVNAWRLSLLFVVSGYASRALLQRSRGVRGFVGNRTLRLLVPLLFAVVVVVPPQPWVQLVTQHHYPYGFGTFWTHHYFRFWTVAGIGLPTWNHMWFVGYLWLYTMVLAAFLWIEPLGVLQRGFDRVFAGWAVLVLPMLWLVVIHGWLFRMETETHDLLNDRMAHLSYFPAFLFGFGLAGSEAAMAAIGRWWKAAAGLAVLGYAAILFCELYWPTNTAPRWIYGWYGTAHAVQQWGGIVALIGIADRWWNRDLPIRGVLTEAVFPFYILHQTVIVVGDYWLRDLGLPGWAEFAILVVATATSCWLFYLLGRSVPLLRPLVGLRQRTRPQTIKEATA